MRILPDIHGIDSIQNANIRNVRYTSLLFAILKVLFYGEPLETH
jgi:hypothetical protein